MLAGDVVRQSTHLLESDSSLPVDEERLWDAVDAIVDRDTPAGVRGVRKRVPELREKLAGRFVVVLHVHAQDDRAPVLVLLPDALERRRLLVAGGSAPRRPEIQHHDAA